MTWQWVLLIIGMFYGIAALGIVSMIMRRETYEHRQGNMFSPTVTRRCGNGATFYERRELEKSAQENDHV